MLYEDFSLLCFCRMPDYLTNNAKSFVFAKCLMCNTQFAFILKIKISGVYYIMKDFFSFDFAVDLFTRQILGIT